MTTKTDTMRPLDRLVLIMLRQCPYSDGGHYPARHWESSETWLAEQCGVPEDKIKKSIRRLISGRRIEMLAGSIHDNGASVYREVSA